MKRRLLSMLLVLVMVLGMFPVTALAAGLDTSELIFDVDNPEGYVTISFVDNGIRPENATILNEELYGEPLGTIIEAVNVPYEDGDNIADVTIRLLNALGVAYKSTGTVDDGFYLSALCDIELNGTYYETFGEFDAGNQSGWCVRLNNWHINQGSSAFEVEAGDVVSWLYTCQFGADVGADFSSKSAEITGVELSDSELTLVYDEEKEQYTCVVPAETSSIAFEVMLENYASVVTVTVDGEKAKYRPNKDISVTADSTIVISTELEYMDADNNNEVTTYTDSMTILLVEEEVIPENTAPTVVADTPTTMAATAGEEISVDLSRFFTDADGDSLTYSIEINALDLKQTLEGSVFTGTIPAAGTYEVVLTASDGKDSVSHTVTLTVTEAETEKNTAPNIKTEYAETNSKTYIYSSSYVYIYMDDIFEDADGDTLTYSATLNGEEVEIAYNSWSKEYYIQFATKPAVYEYKIVASDGKADSQEFTARCIGTSATITPAEEAPLIPDGNYLYYVMGTVETDTFALEYTLDVDEEIATEWTSSNTSALVSNGDGTFTVGEVTSRQELFVGVTAGKDQWNSPLYLGTKNIKILSAMPQVADITAPLAEHDDTQTATVVSNAITGGWYSNEFNYELSDPSVCDLVTSGSYGLSITPKALGSTAVTATFKYDESIKCTFTVTVTGRSLQIKDQPDSDDVIFEAGKTVQLEVLGAEEGETFTWTSSDEAVATVDKNGLVTIQKLGQTYITAVSSLSTEEVLVKASMYLQIKEADRVYLDDLAITDYSYFDGFISAKSAFNSAQLTYDWNLNEARYTYNKLAFTPYFDDESLDAILHYQVSGGEYQTMELADGTSVSITNGLNPGENVVKIDVYPTDDEENITTYTFNIFRPYNPSNTISRMTIYPNGETSLAYPTYKDNREGTLFQWDSASKDFVAGWNGKPATGWSSARDAYKTFIFGSRTSTIAVYPTFAYAGQRVMIYVDGEEFEEAVTNWKSKTIPVDADGTVITFHVNSEKYHAEQTAAGVEDPFAEPEKVYTIYVESVEPLGIDSKILSAELDGGMFYAPGFTSSAYTISGLIPNGETDADLTFTVPAGIDVYKTSVSDANKLTAAEQDDDGNNVYATPIVTITGTGMYAYSTTNIILQVTDEEGNLGKTQYAFTVSPRGVKDVYPDSVVEYLCIGSQYTNASSYGTMPERTLKNGGGVLSLGNFGGYIVYKYDTPIANDPKNPYGVDFVIYGNSFGNGGHEPGYVQVSEDGKTWYTLAGSEHYEDHNDWGYSMTYTNKNGKSAWSNSDGESGEIYNYPAASSYPYFTWTEALEQSMTVNGYRLNSSAKDAYGSAAAVLPVFGYVDVNTNGAISGTSNNPYNHPGTLVAGGDQFDLDWAVDEEGMPVELDSISYIRVATASSIYAGAIGEKSTEVSAVNRVTNTAETAVGETTAPTAITVNGNTIEIPANGGVQTVEISAAAAAEETTAALTVEVTATEGANIYIGNTGAAERAYTTIPEKGIVRVIVQEGEKEPYICYLTIKEAEPAVEAPTLEEMYEATANKLLRQTPGTGSTMGEWLMFGLARSEETISEENKTVYLSAVKAYVEENLQNNGRLHNYKSTENARIALALTALGYDPANFEGNDLLAALENTQWATYQGNNGTAFALLALNAADYDAANEEALIDSLLANQLANGGWSITGSTVDLDSTAMVISALAPYYADSEVKDAVDKALTFLAGQMTDDGTLRYGVNEPAAETVAQVIVALTELGRDPATDEQFTKNGKTLLDGLASFFVESGFAHVDGGEYNQMATEQSFYAMVAILRLRGEETSLYDMSDVFSREVKYTVTVSAVENGTVTVDSEEAPAGAEVTITVTPNIGYELESLTVTDASGTAVAVADNKFTMPASNVTVTAVFAETEDPVQDVEDAIESLTVTKADAATQKKLQEVVDAYNALTEEQKVQVDNAAKLEELTDTFEKLLAVAKEDAEEELESYFGALKEEDYTEDNWKEIQEILEKALGDIEQAENTDEIEEILYYAKRDTENVADGDEITVTFRLIGDGQHDDGVTGHEEYVTWIPTTTYTLEPGATMYDVFMEAIADYGLSQRGAVNNYVESIKAPSALGGYWLGEFDNGPNSGWMYTVNGDHPGTGLKTYDLEDGDRIIWHYVDDYTLEERSPSSKYYYRWLEAEDISPEEYLKKQDKKEDIEAEFDDVDENDWFYDDVQYVVEEGLFNGTGDNKFSPNASMNRAMLVTVLYRLEGEPKVTGSSEFDDVARGQWYTDAVIWATKNEIVNGYGNGKFGPTDNITREQMATILYRYAQYKKYDVSASNSLTKYSDFSDISAYALKSLKWANAEGLITGRTTTTLAPQGTATRAEVAAILHRFVENVVND